MKCEVCKETEIEGELGVSDGELEDGTWIVFVHEVSKRNHIICDSCNKVVCHNCCQHPKTGYCDDCLSRYNLYGYFMEIGVIEENA